MVAATVDGELENPEETQEGKKVCHLADTRLQPLPKVSPEKTQDVKNSIPVPDNWGAYQRKDFSEPRFLYLPIQSKALKSLNWDICFFLN